jgi:hypothetical protein
MCVCVLIPASGCFTPNHSSQTKTSWGKADYTIVSTIFHYVQIFFGYQYILYKKGKEVHILWKWKEVSYDALGHFVLFWYLLDYRRKDNSSVETVHVPSLHNSLKCCRNVTKQNNPLQVDNLITNKAVAILEASRGVLNMTVSKLLFLQMWKI